MSKIGQKNKERRNVKMSLFHCYIGVKSSSTSPIHTSPTGPKSNHETRNLSLFLKSITPSTLKTTSALHYCQYTSNVTNNIIVNDKQFAKD